MVGETSGELIEVGVQLDPARQCAECLGDRSALLERDESGDRASGPLDDDLLATFGERDQPRELTLGLVHSDANHGVIIPGT